MPLFFFVAVVASGCRRMLMDGVTAETVEGPRMLEELEMHFKAGDWAANGVLLLEAEGDACASGTGGDAHDGEFAASWDAPKDGCYRIDAHSAGKKCGFDSPVHLTVDWCAGRTDTLKYMPGADGWTSLGVYPFHPGSLGGISQQEGAVDAFRVVPMKECAKSTPVFGSLTVDTDADEMPEDLASQLADKVANMGDALTAFFHAEKGRRLSSGEKMNQVVVDFDTAKLGKPFTPTEDAISEATQLICSLLDTVECGHAASFKLDESGDVEKVRRPVNPVPREYMWAAAAGLALLAGVLVIGGTAALAKEYRDRSNPDRKTVFVTPKEDIEAEEPAEEKKPQEVEDDNVSTVTPVSLPDSLPSVDDNKAEQQV